MDDQTLLETVWDKLEQAPGSHSFKNAVLGTRTHSGLELRTVLIRKADRATRELWFYTDIRSPKIDQIIQQPAVALLLYDQQEKVQIRACGDANIYHQDAQTRKIWDTLSFRNRLDYLAEPAPGSIAGSADDGLGHIDRTKEDLTDTESGYANFCLVKTAVTTLEWLRLDRGGHERICFAWKGNKWQADWLIP